MRRWETIKGNKRDAEQRLAQRLPEIGLGEFQAAREQITFDALVSAYLAGHVKVAVRASTRKSYEGLIRLHPAPHFQGRPVRSITVADVEKLRACISAKTRTFRSGNEKPVGSRTVNKALTVLSTMLNYALKHRWIAFNPALLVKKVKETRLRADLIDSNILTPEEIRGLLESCEPRWRPIIMAAVYTGLRQGGVAGASVV